MKKRKKIFIFVLLLCTIFSTLIMVRPKVKAVSNSIIGTWTLNETVSSFTERVRINCTGTYTFISNGVGNPTSNRNIEYIGYAKTPYNYNYFCVADGNLGIAFISDGVYTTSNSWSTSNYIEHANIPSEVFTFTIESFDSDVNSNEYQTILSWLNSNATYSSSDPTTYTISGGYQFYPTISSSIFGDISEQELDILLEGNFWLYDNDSVQWDMFTLHTLSSEDTALYFCYESSIFNKYNYVGQLINNNTQIQTYVGERTIYFEEQEVSEDVYNWLNDNGRFGNYDDTLPTPAPDNPFGFVVDMVNDFLQIEFLPGFKFIHLLYIAISIPLLMYILKLFLGG